MEKLVLTVNGQQRQLEIDPATPLLYALRNHLGLKASKYGCGLEQCGACAVLVDGDCQFSCCTPVADFTGRSIITVEGLSASGLLHPVQQAFIAERAAQCGYCTPGMIIAVTALLNNNPDPDEQSINRALAAQLCRCGSHRRILRAVYRAAAVLRTEDSTR